MSDDVKRSEDAHAREHQAPLDEHPRPDLPEHMKPENLEKLRDYGKDSIPPGVA